ncbi:MAG: phosphoglucosamine mutase [Ruminococcus sp.]|nr:phosphoglucosamine mutase [Ruminococcus sp.]
MGRLFGADGARGMEVGSFDHELAEKTGRTAAAVLSLKKNPNPLVIVGRDSGTAAESITDSVCTGICSAGVAAEKLGVLPPSAVSCLVRLHGADAGIMITSSSDNRHCGIRLYSKGGYKLSDETWEEIEQLVFKTPERLEKRIRSRKGGVIVCENAFDEYVEFIKKSVSPDFKGMKTAVYCSDRKNTVIAERILRKTGAEVFVMTEENIADNQEKYKTKAERLADFVSANNLDCGFWFRSGCERCIAVDEKGNITDADSLSAVFAKFLKENGLLKNNTFVVTSAVSFGFLRFAEKHGISVVASGFNERSVVGRMIDGGYNVGADKRGRIIFLDEIPAGDGVFTAVKLLSVMKKTGIPLSSLTGEMKHFQQVTFKIKINHKYREIWKNDSVITDMIEHFRQVIGDTGKISVRENPDKPYISVTAEGKDFKAVSETAMKVAETIKSRTA